MRSRDRGGGATGHRRPALRHVTEWVGPVDAAANGEIAAGENQRLGHCSPVFIGSLLKTSDRPPFARFCKSLLKTSERNRVRAFLQISTENQRAKHSSPVSTNLYGKPATSTELARSLRGKPIRKVRISKKKIKIKTHTKLFQQKSQKKNLTQPCKKTRNFAHKKKQQKSDDFLEKKKRNLTPLPLVA